MRCARCEGVVPPGHGRTVTVHQGTGPIQPTIQQPPDPETTLMSTENDDDEFFRDMLFLGAAASLAGAPPDRPATTAAEDAVEDLADKHKD